MLPYNVRRHVSATKHISLMRIYTTNYFVVPRFDMQIHGGSENLLIEGKKNEILTEHVSLPIFTSQFQLFEMFIDLFFFFIIIITIARSFLLHKTNFLIINFLFQSTRRVPLENISSIFESYITRHVMKTKRFYLNYSQRLGFGRIIGIVELATTP